MEDIAWIKEMLGRVERDVKNIETRLTEDVQYIRNTSLPRIHERIDETVQKVACLEGKIKGAFNNHKGLYGIIFLLLLMMGAILGIKALPKLPFSF